MPSIFGIVSFSLVGLLFSLLSLLLLTRWRGRLDSAVFFVYCLSIAIWAFISAHAAQNEFPINLAVILSELARDLIGAFFLLRIAVLLNPTIPETHLFQLIKKMAIAIPIFLLLLIIGLKAFNLSIASLGYDLRILGQVFIAIIGLSLIEQISRGIKQEFRWALKFFCVAMATFYVFDFYLYSDALLFKQMDNNLWFARPWVYLVGLVLLFIAIARKPELESNVSASRPVVFYITAIILTGIYLIIMSAGGFYLQEYGGEWGKVASITFLFSAIILLSILMISHGTRARLRVLVDKHFLDFKYDYREQWLKLIRELSAEDQSKKIEERALHAITEMMESQGGSLWVRKNQQQYTAIAQFGMYNISEFTERTSGSLAKYLENWQWVINLQEYQSDPGLYLDLKLPDWLSKLNTITPAWLIVPLMLQAKLYGFIIILQPRVEKNFNWEDIDLLKTAGRQVAIHLAQQRSALALVNARQFEAFNRLSAYVVHDLKNLVSQLALLVKNAEKHKNNPEFMDDAIQTVDNAVDRMNRLLAQLRSGSIEPSNLSRINLTEALDKVTKDKCHGSPVPIFTSHAHDIFIRADETRLISVLGHVVQNAQDATSGDGQISIVLKKQSESANLTISDTGSGMDKNFIQERLFKPFDTTKGLTGMGIGAHETRSFIEEMGGTISVESEIDKGSTFTIQLPLLKDAGNRT